MKSPVLALFDPALPSRMETDASECAIRACYLQQKDQKWHPIAYYSRKMTPAEQNYDIHDKELLAIMAALQEWRVYAEGSPSLEILSDHKNLLTFTTTKQLNRRQIRWSELLGQYKFVIRNVRGKDNARADALSRRNDLMEASQQSQAVLVQHDEETLGPNVKELGMVLTRKGKELGLNVPRQPNQDTHEEELIKRCHKPPEYSHPGIKETMRILARKAIIKNLKERVASVLKKCTSCQRNKHSTQKPSGKIQMREPPDRP